MKKPSSFTKVGKEYTAWQEARREIIKNSNDALNRSKRAIFSMHRDDVKGAKDYFKEAEKHFEICEAKFKQFPNLAHEGSYKAALEEYAEARLYGEYRETGKFKELDSRAMDPSTFLAGLCDTTGEITRHAVREATKGNDKEVEHDYQTVEMIVEYLMQLDLTGYLRKKFDEAKRNLRSLEKIMYEISLRR